MASQKLLYQTLFHYNPHKLAFERTEASTHQNMFLLIVSKTNVIIFSQIKVGQTYGCYKLLFYRRINKLQQNLSTKSYIQFVITLIYLRMENAAAFKISNLPLTASTLIHSSTLRNASRNKSKSRKTCETKVSSMPKAKRPNSNNHRNTLKNDSWKADSHKKIKNSKKRTQSQSFQKNQFRYSVLYRKDDSVNLSKSKNPKKSHYFSGEDYSQLYNLHSPAQRSHIVKRSVFQETLHQKNDGDFFQSRQLSTIKNNLNFFNSQDRSKNSTSVMQPSDKCSSIHQQILNRTVLVLMQYRRKCEQLEKDKVLYQKRYEKAMKKVKVLQQKRKGIGQICNK